MVDSPSHEWGEGDPRILTRRAKETREPGEPEGDNPVVTDEARKPIAGGMPSGQPWKAPPPKLGTVKNKPHDKSAPPEDEPKKKAVSSKSAENKAVGSATTK